MVRFCLRTSLSLALLAAVPVFTAPLISFAQSIDIVIGRPPPPPREEVIPPPPNAVEYVWDRGHWSWRDGAHVWVPGHYVKLPHPGAVRVHGHWEEMPGGRWRFIPPHWE